MEPTSSSASVTVTSPLQGTVVSVVEVGTAVRAGDVVAVIESMKMEHEVRAVHDGSVRTVHAQAGDQVAAGAALVEVLTRPPTPSASPTDGVPSAEPGPNAISSAGGTGEEPEEPVTPGVGVRADLAEVLDRHAIGLDEHRTDAVAKRHERGHRTARENIDDLCDDGSFVEYGPLVIAAQRRRRSVEELIERTPADGLVGGVGQVGGRSVVAMSYDYTVLAGTQGLQNHRKKDRLFELAARQRLPVVLFAEGGGGRPGDTDGVGPSGLDCMAFRLFAELSGLVPLVGIASGRCYAGNAALLGCCDVVIATADANIGMGGPAMIEGGGLGVFAPEDIGPMSVQVPNGVVDVAVADEAEAVSAAKRYLSYFAGPTDDWTAPDQEALRDVVPENRVRAYDIHAVIDGLADVDSVLELRAGFGVGMVTALARVGGRPLGIVANNPTHLGGAIDAEGADKAARFLQLCDAHDLPVLFLCDTPGFMVGPDAEATALVRHVSRLFVIAASMDVPVMTIVVRKGYGLGAQSMAAGSFKSPLFTVGWPTSEFGGMGLEGAVRLGFRRELDAIADAQERQQREEELIALAYERGKGLSTASYFEIDDVIDPADSRRWIEAALAAAPAPVPRPGKKRPCIDAW